MRFLSNLFGGGSKGAVSGHSITVSSSAVSLAGAGAMTGPRRSGRHHSGMGPARAPGVVAADVDGGVPP